VTRQILITIQDGTSTRTIGDDAALLGKIRLGVTSLVIDHTRGPVPSVKVIRLPDVQEWDTIAAIPVHFSVPKEK
jgi:hypothetical protein